MDCHRCIHIRYDGRSYGHCTHPCHLDVVLRRGDKDGRRPYNRQTCADFKMRRRCSNCKYWKRGKYFADGRTPATKGFCTLEISKVEPYCPVWRQGPTSGKRKKGKKHEKHEEGQDNQRIPGT